MPDPYRRRFMLGGQLIRRGSSVLVDSTVPPAPASSARYPAFAYGTVEPWGEHDNTELRLVNVGPRFPLTRVDTNITIAAGQVVQKLDIYGTVTFTGPGILRDCIVRGPVARLGVDGGSVDRLVDPLTAPSALVSAAARNLRGGLIEWCRLDAMGYESAWQSGIRGGNFTCRYSEINGVVDGASMSLVGGGKLLGCRISRGYYTGYADSVGGINRAGFPAGSDRTLPDGCHITQARGWQIVGCSIGGTRSSASAIGAANTDPAIPTQLAVIRAIDAAGDFDNAGILISTPGASNPVGAFINRNWLQGGAASITIDAKSTDHMAGVIVTNNRFIRPSSGLALNVSSQSLATVAGNVYDDDGSPVTVTTYTGV